MVRLNEDLSVVEKGTIPRALIDGLVRGCKQS